jgi:hypothetical protein
MVGTISTDETKFTSGFRSERKNNYKPSSTKLASTILDELSTKSVRLYYIFAEKVCSRCHTGV